MNETFYIIFNLVTFINLLTLSLILILRKKNSITNIILALIIIDPGLNFLNNVLILTDTIHKVPFFLFIFQGTGSLYGPLVYAYVLLMIGKNFKWFELLNILTFLGILLDVYYAFEFYSLPIEKRTQYLNCLKFIDCYPSQMNTINGIYVVLMLGYFIKAVYKLNKHTFAVQNFFSEIERLKLNYLQTFLYLLITLNIILTLSYIFIKTAYVEYFIIPFLINVFYIFVLYYAFTNNAVFTKIEYCTLVDQTEKMEQFQNFQDPLCKEIKELMQEKNYKKYKLTNIEIEENYQKILKYINESKPYLDPEINLTKFSSALNACSHNISLTINTRFKMNFFEFINYYRVEEAKKLLSTSNLNEITIEAIGYDCGFNSKSSFYRAFKKFTGMTPTEYIENSLSNNNKKVG